LLKFAQKFREIPISIYIIEVFDIDKEVILKKISINFFKKWQYLSPFYRGYYDIISNILELKNEEL